MAAPVYQSLCNPVKYPIPAVRLEPHPGYAGSIATYVTSEGRLLPLWTQAEVERSYEVIAWCREQAGAAA